MLFSYFTRSLGMKKLYGRLFEPLLTQYALTQLEMDILLFLSNHPGWDTARDIVELRHLSKSQVSAGIEHLAARGLLERRHLNGNRKTIHLRLMPAAGEIVRRGQAVLKQYASLLVADFSEEEKNQLNFLLNRITQNVQCALSKQNDVSREIRHNGGVPHEE